MFVPELAEDVIKIAVFMGVVLLFVPRKGVLDKEPRVVSVQTFNLLPNYAGKLYYKYKQYTI